MCGINLAEFIRLPVISRISLAEIIKDPFGCAIISPNLQVPDLQGFSASFTISNQRGESIASLNTVTDWEVLGTSFRTANHTQSHSARNNKY